MINFVPFGSRVADIGADHGYLAIELAKTSRADFVIATDKNPGPLDSAKKNISAENLENIIETRLGDGLQILKIGEVDTICIGGMGGALICKIFDDSPQIFNSIENFIIQPMNAVEKVKTYLTAKNFFILDINLAEVGGIIYEIIFASKNKKNFPAQKKFDSSPLREKYLNLKIEKLQRILEEMSKSSVATSSEKFLQIQNNLNALKNFYKNNFYQ